MFSLGETMEFLLGNPFSTPVGQRIGESQQRVFEVLPAACCHLSDLNSHPKVFKILSYTAVHLKQLDDAFCVFFSVMSF